MSTSHSVGHFEIPADSTDELKGFYSSLFGLAAPPQVLEKMKHLAEENLDQETWNKVKERANLQTV